MSPKTIYPQVIILQQCNLATQSALLIRELQISSIQYLRQLLCELWHHPQTEKNNWCILGIPIQPERCKLHQSKLSALTQIVFLGSLSLEDLESLIFITFQHLSAFAVVSSPVSSMPTVVIKTAPQWFPYLMDDVSKDRNPKSFPIF